MSPLEIRTGSYTRLADSRRRYDDCDQRYPSQALQRATPLPQPRRCRLNRMSMSKRSCNWRVARGRSDDCAFQHGLPCGIRDLYRPPASPASVCSLQALGSHFAGAMVKTTSPSQGRTNTSGSANLRRRDRDHGAASGPARLRPRRRAPPARSVDRALLRRLGVSGEASDA